jgi:hypothetical protein
MATAKRASTKRPAVGLRAARPTLKEYRALVTARLDELRPKLIKELRERVFVFPIPAGAKSLDYEIQDTTLGAGDATILGYFMDGNGGQVMIPKPGGKWDPYIPLLTSKEHMLPRTVAQQFDDAGVETWKVSGPAILRWFIDGWKAAGGKTRFPLPASVSFHDDDPTPLPSASSTRK